MRCAIQPERTYDVSLFYFYHKNLDLLDSAWDLVLLIQGSQALVSRNPTSSIESLPYCFFNLIVRHVTHLSVLKNTLQVRRAVKKIVVKAL
jgi:hypothetical protein